ncbi:MAG: hypothetical protein LBQ42_02540 [Synergistaceae bacterium]|nr:hypothetical protein [Synergistaceae bacterium]
MRRWKLLALIGIFVSFWSAAASADIFYSATDGSASSFGTISGASYTVRKDLYTLPLGYPTVASFSDLGGKEWVVVENYNWQDSVSSTVDIFDLKDWTKPAGGEYTDWGTNIKGLAVVGDCLYIASFERREAGEEKSGEVIRVDLSGQGSPDKPFEPDGTVYKFSPLEDILRRPAAMEVVGGKIYVLTYTYDGVHTIDAGMGASELFEFDENLELLRSAVIGGGDSGKNTQYMASYGGKLYLGSTGGAQGASSIGAVWEVNPGGTDLEATKIVDLGDIPDLDATARSVYGVSIADDGTALLIVGGYDSENDWSFSSRLYVATASALSAGEYGEPISIPEGTYVESVKYDAKLDVFWCGMSGAGYGNLEARGKSGAILKTITANELGNNIGTFAIIGETPKYEPSVDSASSGGGCNAGIGAFAFLLLAFSALLKIREK